MKLISLLLPLALVSLVGCAERYFSGKGAEYLVYEETHSFAISVQDKESATKKVSNIIEAVEAEDSSASYSIQYRNTAAKQVVDKALKDHPYIELSAEAFSLSRAPNIDSDINIIVSYDAMVRQECTPSQIETKQMSRNCFSENARLQQVADKKRIIRGI